MKNIVLASVLGLSLISTAWATETVKGSSQKTENKAR